MWSTGAKDAAKEVVEEEVIIKDTTGEAENSTAHYTHHPSKIEGRSWQFLRGLRDHFQTERSQGPVQEVQQ